MTRPGLPAVRIALGASAVRRVGSRFEDVPERDRYPRVQSVYQQLHNYPVGSSGGGRAETTFGNKYNISPVRRELLVGLRAVIALDGSADLEDRVRRGAAGESSARRYGLPFLGDNAFLPDRIDVADPIPPAHWYERVTAGEEKVRPRTTRLTVLIDRADMSRTRSDLYAPTDKASADIPTLAWTELTPA